MAEGLSLVAIVLLVAFVLVKAYTTKVLGQRRREASRLIAEERHARQEMDREQTLLEGAEARLSQLQHDRDTLTKELEQLRAKVEEVEGELRRLKGRDDEAASESDATESAASESDATPD